MTEAFVDAPLAARPPVPPSTRTAVIVLSAVAAALLVACVVMAVLLLIRRNENSSLSAARDAAVAAARQEVLNLDSLSAATVDRDLKRVLDGSTGTFKDQFTRAEPDLKTLIVGRRSVTSGTIDSAAVVRADDSTATVLVAVDRSVTDSTDPNGAVTHDRWRVDLEKHGGRWLVADLQPVG